MLLTTYEKQSPNPMASLNNPFKHDPLLLALLTQQVYK